MALEFEDEGAVAVAFARLIVTAADDHGAPCFALDMAVYGCSAYNLRGLANEWKGMDFQPPEFADDLFAFASALEEFEKEEE